MEDEEFSEAELLVNKKGGLKNRGRNPKQSSGKNHIEIAMMRFVKKQQNKANKECER